MGDDLLWLAETKTATAYPVLGNSHSLKPIRMMQDYLLASPD